MGDQLAPSDEKLRIAAFGFRSLPPTRGGAGADKFALELLPRLAARGHHVVAYNRVYPGHDHPRDTEFQGVEIVSFRTVASGGFDTLLHSLKATWDIIRHNRADIVHIQNGGNSPFALILRLFGKRTFLSQDGLDWNREKWPWYGKLYLRLMVFLTGRIHNEVICDNVFVQEYFEKRFRKPFAFIPFGADVSSNPDQSEIIEELGLERGKYLLFVGRFIPDKGLQYLIPAFERLDTDLKLVLIGGSPNPSSFESQIKSTSDSRILFPGFVYGQDTHALMKNCLAYVQPSDVEGLSPVILESSFLGAPVICSDIDQNKYILGSTGLYFKQGDVQHLHDILSEAIANPDMLGATASKQRKRIVELFSWDSVVDQHLEVFRNTL